MFKARQTRKAARELLRHAKHLRNMREDVFSEEQLSSLKTVEVRLRDASKAGGIEDIERAGHDLHETMARLAPRRPLAAFRENFEILVVAFVVAMGFRTYFVQPFKIPTGSMEPTLYGIHADRMDGPAISDRMPLKLVKWLVTGKWYKEIRVEIPGELSRPYLAGSNHPSSFYINVGAQRYLLPKGAALAYRPGDYVPQGSVLWSGILTTGDHVFVDRIRWNFVKPKRAQVMVFGTRDISGLPEGTHYIKRLIGRPGETVGISPPNVLIDGEELLEPAPVRRIARQEPGYEAGFTLPERGPALLNTRDDSLDLGEAEYFALGDNTRNSKDGRYWGTVPRENLVGPAFLVYWPLSKRWGLVR